MNPLRRFLDSFNESPDVREHTIILCAIVCILVAFVGGLSIGMNIGYNKSIQQKDTHARTRQ